MSYKIFSGLYTALVTPFTKDNKIDYKALERLIEKQIAGGVNGLIILGTTGESPTIHDDEARKLIKTAISIVSGRVQVLIGTGSNSTEHAIELSRQAERFKADGLLLVNPYYNKPSQEGMFHHFASIAGSVTLPIMLYNIKGRTGINLATQTVTRLSLIHNIKAMKEASGDIEQIMDVIRETPDDFSVLSGDDVLTLPLMALGGDGVVSVIANMYPKKLRHLVEAMNNNDYEGARDIHYALLDAMRGFLNISSNPIPIKTALAMQGLCEEKFRLPLYPMDERGRLSVQKLVEKLRD